MIKLENAHIEEFRGIRKLDVDFHRNTFVVSGPNGSGKSGVIDAIEFGLTGQIGRLSGQGTKGLSISEHGPHVDKIKSPDAAFVRLKVFIPEINKSATITRKVSSPRKPKIVPGDDDVKLALAEVAEHPEITLSRREILRFILTEPTKRSEEIQTILRLDEIGEVRSALYSAQNKLQLAHGAANAQVLSGRNTLLSHLQISSLNAADLLKVVNQRRMTLGLAELTEVNSDTQLDSGLSLADKADEFNKRSALRDLTALSEAAKTFADLAKAEAAAMIVDIEKLEFDPALLMALQRRSLIEQGLELTDGPECPLCDKSWDDEEQLRNHLKGKLAKSDEAGKIEKTLLKNGLVLSAASIRIAGLLSPVQKLSASQGDLTFAALLSNWIADFETLKSKLGKVDEIIGLKHRLESGWVQLPAEFSEKLTALTAKVEGKPDQSATVDAQTFLTTAQIRFGDYQATVRKSTAAGIALKRAKVSYEAYCSVLENELNTLYDAVQKDFSGFYREINDDESQFTAKFTPSEGTLDFDVSFYEKGLFPPSAYHSEGHQDSMGVCLYLALMKRLFGSRFTIALLDDVVMSVDSGHRYEFCKLLKSKFPNTQFLITTHDRLWAEQLKSAGLVTSKNSLEFHGWTIETGPLVESNQGIWEEIAAELRKDRVARAASALRRHLEYVSWLLADQLGAMPQFRADGNYELGDLLSSVLTRVKELYGKAATAAQSWGKTNERDAATKKKEILSRAAQTSNVERWAINRAVHYNAWANFAKSDFEPVVSAFKNLLACFRCESCGSWVYVTPRINAESLRCACDEINLNLKPKPK